jgi:hypothetical protein
MMTHDRRFGLISYIAAAISTDEGRHKTTVDPTMLAAKGPTLRDVDGMFASGCTLDQSVFLPARASSARSRGMRTEQGAVRVFS